MEGKQLTTRRCTTGKADVLDLLSTKIRLEFAMRALSTDECSSFGTLWGGPSFSCGMMNQSETPLPSGETNNIENPLIVGGQLLIGGRRRCVIANKVTHKQKDHASMCDT